MDMTRSRTATPRRQKAPGLDVPDQQAATQAEESGGRAGMDGAPLHPVAFTRFPLSMPAQAPIVRLAAAGSAEPPTLPAAGEPGGFGPPAAEEADGVEEIAAVLREEICLLDHGPGTALSENAMAKRFDTSRTVIKRVFYRLEYDGLVESIAGVGTIVTSIDLVYLQQVYALRFKLTELVADFSAGRVTEEHLERMRQLADAAEALGVDANPNYRELARLYMYFAQEFGQAIGNRPFFEIMDRLFYQTSRVYLQVLPDMEWEQEVDIAVQEMRDIADAMDAKDMAEVARIRRYHMAWNLRRFNHYLSSAIFDVDTTKEFEFDA